MKKIELNTYSDRVGLECSLSEVVFKFLIDNKYYKESDLVTIVNDEVYNTELGEDIEAGISNILNCYIKVLGDEIEYDLENDYEELTKEELLMDIYNELIFTDDLYILPDGTELTNFDEHYVRNLEFDTIKHYLK